MRFLCVLAAAFLVLPRCASAVCVDHDLLRLDVRSRVYLTSELGDVAVAGSLACVAFSQGGLHVCGISGSGGMALLRTVPLTGAMYGVALSGNYAFVVGQNAVHIVDVSEPAAAARCGTVTINTTATRARIAGRYLYVATGTGLMIFDITIPCVPTQIASVSGGLTDVVIAGGFAYAVRSGWMKVIDVTNPARPVEVAGFSVPDHTARFVAVSGNYAYLVGYFYGLDVVDISNPRAPRLVAQAWDRTGYWPQDIEVMGSLVIVGRGQGSLSVYDVTDPLHPLGSFSGCCSAAGLAVVGDRVYTAGAGALVMQRLGANPGVPIIGAAAGFNDPRGIAAAGDLVCVADGEWGLRLLDAADPLNPVVLGRVATPGSASGVVIDGTIAWVADDTRGLQAVDIADPARPRLVGGVDTPGNARRLVIAGDLAFVADGGAGLQVVDIADPAHPRLAGVVDTHGYAMDVVIKGTQALVADYGSGVAVIDIADPLAPRLEFQLDTPGEAWGIAVAGPAVFVADGSAGVHSVSLPSAGYSHIYRTYNLAGYACDITASGDVLYVSSWDAGVHEICRYPNVSDAWIRNRLETPGAATAVAVSGRAVFVADYGRGVQVLPAHCESVAGVAEPTGPPPPPRRELVVHPNPTTGRATIQMSRAQPGPMRAAVYDLAGRRVRELAVDAAAADQDLVWDGRDDSGRDAAAGVYFVKVRTADGEAVGRVVRLR